MTRKKLTRTIPVLLIVLATACSKKPQDIIIPTPDPVTNTRISKIEYDHYSIEAGYHANGDIATLASRAIPADPNDHFNYLFTYKDGKLEEALFGGKWKYVYNGNHITKVETHNANGIAKYQTDFLYLNNRVVEKTESMITSLGTNPKFRTFYVYTLDGNLAKKTVFQMLNGTWEKQEEITYPEYDSHANLSQVFENNPFVPTALYFTNNPLKEVFRDKDGTITETILYTYIYDTKGRVTTRTATHKYTAFPDFVDTIKISY